MEKILKTLDALKMPTLSSLDTNVPGNINSAVVAASDSVKTKKKERISYCIAVTDAVCSTNIQVLGDYSKILENVTEVLFQLCNDPDSDIRLVASDCLNRIVRTVKDQYQHRFQMEVYKEIKKNQNPRSLRTALNLFAFMSPLIRPQKCRVFMLSLLPCFAQIARRTEEMLYEHLAPAFCEIFKNLGPFINDNEVKILCKDFSTNLESSSAIVRRSSASILVYICQYSRKPHVFLPKLLSQVSELLVPNLMEKSVAVIIGVLLCIRQSIPPIFEHLRHNFEKKSPDQENVVKNLIQVYEMCMLLCNHDDHNVITTSLETLQQLLNSPVEPIIQRLTSPLGIQNSLDVDKWDIKTTENFQMSSSRCSLAFSDATNLLEGDSDVPNFRSLISSTTSEAREDFDVDISLTSSRRNSDVFVTERPQDFEFGSSMEVLQQSDDEQVGRSFSLALHNFPEIHIGSLYESNIPIYYCARFLSYNFLLAGRKDHERPDSEVRISVKVLATNCLMSLINICPEIFSLPLSADENEQKNENAQVIHDITLYLKHADPLLRGSCYVLIGNLVNSIRKSGLDVFPKFSMQVSDLIPKLNEGLRDSSNIGVKCAISGISACITSLLRTEATSAVVSEIIETLLATVVNSYWLVKVDILEILAAVEWNCVADRKRVQQDVLYLFLDLLADEDLRVRTASCNAILKYIGMNSSLYSWNQNEIVLCDHFVLSEVALNLSQDQGCTCRTSATEIVYHLELVVNEMLARLSDQEEKPAIAGFYYTLGVMSERFPPTHYKLVWRCVHIPEVPSLFSLSLDILRSSPIVYDIAIHQSVLSLVCNLFIGIISNADDNSSHFSEGNVFFHPETTFSSFGVQIVHHCLAVIKLYQSLLECTSFSQTQTRKISTSPVVSPVRKFSQKLESEKKSSMTESEPDKKSKSLVLMTTTCANHFKKIAETLAQSWKVYKSNLDPAVTVKFTSLLITSLNTLGQMFDYIRPDFIGLANLIDEVLNVTSSVFHLCPIPTLRCVQKMLKCLFSSFKSDVKKSKIQSLTSNYSDIKDPIEKFWTFANTYHKLLMLSRRNVVVKTPSEKSILGNYIRQFEPIVVTALRMYTTSSDVQIQSEVLRLLSQLIKGHVNYGLVDKSQVFLGFVIKQIGFLEEGHIRNGGQLVEEMFDFLTLLSHEQHHSNRFIDVPKILRLCDGLVASGQNPVTHCIPALKRVVHDLFIQRNQSTNTQVEKKEIETQREVLFQMLVKLATIPETVSVLWLVIEGRRGLNELKWEEDSATVIAYLLPLIENGELQISNRRHFCNLMGLLYSISVTALPPVDNIVATLQETIKLSKHTQAVDFLQWQLLVTSHWLLLVKLINTTEGSFSETDCNAGFVLNLISTYVGTLASIVRSSYFANNREFVMELLVVFLQGVTTYIREGKCSTVIQELQLKEHNEVWMSITKNLIKLTVFHPTLRSNAGELLSTLLYPSTQVWSLVLEGPAECMKSFVPYMILRLMKSMNEADVSTLEEWLTLDHTRIIIMNIDNPTVVTFLSRLSRFRITSMMKSIHSILNEDIEVLMAKNIIKFLERVYQNNLLETGVLSIRLMQKVKEPFVLLEILQFACFIFSLLDPQEIEIFVEDASILINFVNETDTRIRYPRLVALIEKFEEIKCNTSRLEVKHIPDTPITAWCCGEITRTEGIALAKLLSGLNYSQVVSIFNLPNFNMGILAHCFSYLQSVFLKEKITAGDIVDLFSSEKRSCLIEKWPLGVATFDFILDTLDKWESLIDEDVVNTSDKNCDKLVKEINFGVFLPAMWKALEAMLTLKACVIKSDPDLRTSCRNNFIPTKIFTLSFQFMRVKILKNGKNPVQNLDAFLSFASLVICDMSFMTFFNVRDDPKPIFACTNALGVILRHIVRSYNVNFSFTHSPPEYWWSDMNSECSAVLTEFSRLSDFVHHVDSRRSSLDSKLYKSFRNLVAGIGRCDVINVWILISHLGWKPPSLLPSQVFPPMQHVPVDILQNEKDLLLQYIFKLSLFGVASKVQFEENWMTFLSVINSYGDENSQLQIICTGLRALAMMLEKTVTFYYVPSRSAAKGIKGLADVHLSLKNIEPDLCKTIQLAPLMCDWKKEMNNSYDVDVNSCIRFLTDLFSQWLQSPQGKMPLLLLSEVVQSIVRIAEYFEDTYQYTWMYDTLMEIFKSFEKEDEIIWPHLIYGIFYAAAKIPLESEPMANLAQILEGALLTSCVNVSSAAIQSSLIFLQHHPENLPLLNVITPYVLKNTHLAETLSDSENHCCAVWKLLIFIWINGPADNIGVASFEQETLSNILTVLSPLNKVYISVRLLVLKGLQMKIQLKTSTSEAKRSIAKAAFDTLKTGNISVFFETVKLFITIFYTDFEKVYQTTSPEPELLMQMAERSEVLFQLLRHSVRYNSLIVSKVIPHVITDFLPPSEIINRVIAEFLNSNQHSPELLAPVVAQLFSKARLKPKEASLVREWIVSSVPNFLANPDVSRTSWSLSLIFIGVSTTPEVANLLPLAELRRSPLNTDLFAYSALDFYKSLDSESKEEFKQVIEKGPFLSSEKNPYKFFVDLMHDS